MADDNSWVFDSLVCFLHGPVWNAPLQTFIEEKSLIFDPNVQIDEKNVEYKKIHDEYKNLVDLMLGSFMEELQITPEQFEIACLEGRNGQEGEGNAFSFHQGLFQQIWAANDVRIFVRMMTQRNVEIQLQALDLIERRQLSKSSRDNSVEKVEDNVAAESASHSSNVESTISPEIDDLVEDEEELKQIVKSMDKEREDPAAADESETIDKFRRLNLFFEKDEVSSADVKSRQDYLRTQRDKILQIKKQVRARQLNDTVKKSGRPTSATAAQNLLDGNTSHLTGNVPSKDSLLLRQTLARRLRNEVVQPDD